MTNLFNEDDAAAEFTLFGRDFATVATRLDGLMMVLKTCAADSCRKPWNVLHPNDPSVTSLKQALSEEYDDLYKGLPKVSYSLCAQGYILDYEGPSLNKRDLFALWPEWT
jgi:N-acetylglucosamine-6-sulfatase